MQIHPRPSVTHAPLAQSGRGTELRPQRFLVRIQGAALFVSSFYVPVAQQRERLFTKQQVAGANPAGDIFLFLERDPGEAPGLFAKEIVRLGAAWGACPPRSATFLTLSSNGSGHPAFYRIIRVRIPSGSPFLNGPKLRQRSSRLLTGIAGCMSLWTDHFHACW